MQIIAKCPACNTTWLLDERNQDKRVKCKKCGRIFRIPIIDEIPKAANVIKRAKANVYVDEFGNTFG